MMLNHSNSHNHHTSKGATPRRPSSIAELAEKARLDLYDDRKDFKHYLRNAEKYRKDGKECAKRGDLEGAFVELARAATLVLEKLPCHRDYNIMLNANQRHNLALNGQDILDNLSDIKPTLVERYDKWLQRHPDGIDHEQMPNAWTQQIANVEPAYVTQAQRRGVAEAEYWAKLKEKQARIAQAEAVKQQKDTTPVYDQQEAMRFGLREGEMSSMKSQADSKQHGAVRNSATEDNIPPQAPPFSYHNTLTREEADLVDYKENYGSMGTTFSNRQQSPQTRFSGTSRPLWTLGEDAERLDLGTTNGENYNASAAALARRTSPSTYHSSLAETDYGSVYFARDLDPRFT